MSELLGIVEEGMSGRNDLDCLCSRAIRLGTTQSWRIAGWGQQSRFKVAVSGVTTKTRTGLSSPLNCGTTLW